MKIEIHKILENKYIAEVYNANIPDSLVAWVTASTPEQAIAKFINELTQAAEHVSMYGGSVLEEFRRKEEL